MTEALSSNLDQWCRSTRLVVENRPRHSSAVFVHYDVIFLGPVVYKALSLNDLKFKFKNTLASSIRNRTYTFYGINILFYNLICFIFLTSSQSKLNAFDTTGP